LLSQVISHYGEPIGKKLKIKILQNLIWSNIKLFWKLMN
jgi:hypothetical protein